MRQQFSTVCLRYSTHLSSFFRLLRQFCYCFFHSLQLLNPLHYTPHRNFVFIWILLYFIQLYRNLLFLPSLLLIQSWISSFLATLLIKSFRMIFIFLFLDEAAQAVEPSTLIPFKFNPHRVVMVGDPCQLPATVFSRIAKDANYGQSLFQVQHLIITI